MEQLEGDLFLRFVNIHHAGLLTFERPGDQLDDVAFHDAADDRLRSEVCLDFRERDSGRLSLAFHDAARPPEAPAALPQAAGVQALYVAVPPEVPRPAE